MAEHPIGLSPTGPPETVLDSEPADALLQLDTAMAMGDPAERRNAVSSIVSHYPRFLDGWARLSELARDDVEGYAAARVGYHRGLDRLRQNGWRGSGYVRWEHQNNRGFLRALAALHHRAQAIGEADEEERTFHFLHQCDPSWPPPDMG